MSSLNELRDILIADDDPDDVEILELALQKAKIPYTLRHAQDGKQLFVMLKEQKPYILFLDIRMPCEDGVSCIISIRKNPEYDKLPIIIYSSVSYSKYVEACYRNGANYFIVKPAHMENIVASLRHIFAIDWKNYQHFPMLDEFLIK